MICLVLVFVRGPGLTKFLFIGGKGNDNIFTKILISTNKLRVTVTYRLTPCFPPKRNHGLVIRDHCDMDRCSGIGAHQHLLPRSWSSEN